MRPLFRADAVAYAGQAAPGQVLLTRSKAQAVVVATTCLVALAIVAFVVLASYTRKAQVTGVLLPSDGLVRLVAPSTGVIVRRAVEEGQAVRAGELLFVISNEREDSASGSAERHVSELLRKRQDSVAAERAEQVRQSAQRMQALEARAQALAADLDRLVAQHGLQQRRADLALQALQRYERLAAADFVSGAQVHDKQADLLDQQQRLADLQRARGSMQRDLLAVQAELRDVQAQSRRDEQATLRALAALQQDLVENEARRELAVRAPADGTIAAVTAQPGQSIAAHQVLASLLPAGSQLEAELYAPSRAAGFIRTGMPVLLRYQAFAYQKFGQARGTVREVARSALKADEVALAGVLPPGAEPVYRVRVRLERQVVDVYGAPQPLRPGALLDASVLLEERRLLEWLLDPLYAVTGRV
ncbi:HlyD family secretion protein [Ramlibacter algicola]|uniref:HlyD family efflux transporter periplasmic adaptor subunit n=1 Tax=Ramlibacter algicola TaxID=2795217 RepID=A0A934PWW9_9BURK|nr:HlyD family efflux transporter periplasmic adaptor subunit [Ramlibacter algicola]MBK0392000.1 HlyD family efflux transporter periplasmic adaptor subunit [Ramlibacter algicola]